VRDDAVTVPCPICGRPYQPIGRRRHCSNACRTAAWRRRTIIPPAPPQPQPRTEVVYQCPACDARLLGVQRCEDCNTWARRIGPGGPCPHCDEPVSVFDLLAPEQFTGSRHHPADSDRANPHVRQTGQLQPNPDR